MNPIKEVQREQSENPISVEDALKQSERLAMYGEQQTKKLGLKTDLTSINWLVHERRKARKSA